VKRHLPLVLAGAALLAACRDPAPASAPVPTVAAPAPAVPAAVASTPLPVEASDAHGSTPPIGPPLAVAGEVHDGTPRGDSARCLAGTGAKVARQERAIHRWVDAAGIVHYADRAPSGVARDHRLIATAGGPPVSVEANGYDVNLPADLHARAVADALAIDRILRTLFAADGDDRLALRIVFVQSPEAYARFIGEPDLARSAGAYSARERTVYVRAQASEAIGFAVLRHEIVHALVHERIGNLPTPLNEGLAGYFERLEVAGQGGRVDIGPLRARLAAAVPADPAADLADLLAVEGPAFYREHSEQRYARAFALVALLMQDVQGRALLGKVLAQQRESPCEPVAAEHILDAGYPGGLQGLAAALARWMAAPDAAVHAW